MLPDVLVAAVVVVSIATVALFVAGRRALELRARLFLAASGAVAATAGAVSGTLTAGQVVALVAIVAVATVLPRHWYVVGTALFAALLVAFGVYAIYLVGATLALATDPVALLLGVVLLVLELGAMALMLGSAFEMVDALCAPEPRVDAPPPPARWPVVCLQVPTYNEPPSLVIETVRSLVALDYPALRVQVIDNNTTDPELWRPVEAEADRLRANGHAVEFVHLPEWPGYKAGALNWGLGHLADDVEIVGVVDADYVVDPGWLRSVVPHFAAPDVAFVQTPQDYRAWESSAFYRACYVGFAYFFRVGMVSRSRRNSIIFAGTMGLVRRSLLEAAGGWDEAIITEDAELSLRLLARGGRGVYVPTSFGRGLMPLTYEALRKQRFRWAFGGIQILRKHWRRLLDPATSLTIGQRVDHLLGGLWWFNDALTFGFTAFVVAAALGAALGRPFVVQQLTGIGIVLPVVLVVVNLVRYAWALGPVAGVRPPLALAALRVNLSLSWVIALACVRGLVQEHGVFLRTPKFAGAPALRELRVVAVETAIAAVCLLLAIALGLLGGGSARLVLILLLGWALLIYGSATGFALGDPTRAPLGSAFREKARLEIAPRIGRVTRSGPVRAAGATTITLVAAVFVAIAAESGQPARLDLPFSEGGGPPVADLAGRPPALAADPTPTASSQPSESLPASPTALATSRPSAGEPRSSNADSTSGPTSTPTPRPTPAPTPAPTAPRPTPAPTVPPPPGPSSHPTPPASPARTPAPHPTPPPVP